MNMSLKDIAAVPAFSFEIPGPIGRK